MQGESRTEDAGDTYIKIQIRDLFIWEKDIRRRTPVRSKLIIDGNAFYEIDEECMQRKEQEEQEKKENKEK